MSCLCSFYFKTNSSYNYNNSNHAWPPPPSPLANQHEAQNSPVASQNEARSPVSPDQHFVSRTNLNYSQVPTGYSDHYKVTSPGYSGHSYKTSGQQSPSYSGQSFTSLRQAHTVHGQGPSNHISSYSTHGHSSSTNVPSHTTYGHTHTGYGQGTGHQKQSPSQFHNSQVSQQYSPVSSPQSPLYQGSTHNQPRHTPSSGQHSPGYNSASHEHSGQGSANQYLNNHITPVGRNTNQYGQHFVSRESHMQQNLNRYQNVQQLTSPSEISPTNTSVLHTAYRDHSNQHVPMSPVHEQSEPRDLDYHGNTERDLCGNIEHGRHGNLHGTTNSMPLDPYPHHR